MRIRDETGRRMKDRLSFVRNLYDGGRIDDGIKKVGGSPRQPTIGFSLGMKTSSKEWSLISMVSHRN